MTLSPRGTSMLWDLVYGTPEDRVRVLFVLLCVVGAVVLVGAIGGC